MNCDSSGILEIILIVKKTLNIIQIAAPIILIIFAMFDFVKLTASSDVSTSKTLKKVITRVILAVLVFLVPSILNIVLSFIDQKNFQETNCWTNANEEYIEDLKAKEEKIKQEKLNAQNDKQKISYEQKKLESLKKRLALEALKDNNNFSNIQANSIPEKERIAKLFPNGEPSSDAEAKKYMTTIQVEISGKNNNPHTVSLQVHKGLAEEVKTIFKEMKNAGAIIYEVGGYRWEKLNSKKLSAHSLGFAIDMNANENYYIKGNTKIGSFWNPSTSKYSFAKNGPVVSTFKKHGFYWGGDWTSLKDYMHFSYINR